MRRDREYHGQALVRQIYPSTPAWQRTPRLNLMQVGASPVLDSVRWASVAEAPHLQLRQDGWWYADRTTGGVLRPRGHAGAVLGLSIIISAPKEKPASNKGDAG